MQAIDSDIRALRQLLERSQFPAALAAAQALFAKAPRNRDVLYMLAIAQRYSSRLADALATLSQLEACHGDYPRLYQERGHCELALGRVADAIKSFEQAVKMNPSLIASLKALQSLYEATGRRAEAEHVAGELANLAKLPGEIVTAYSMYADNELPDAERLLRSYLQAHGFQAEGMRLLAQIGMRLDAAEDAEILLAKVVELAPDYDAARYDYASALLKRHKYAQAREQLDHLLARGPSNPSYRGLLASVYAGFGDHGRALPLYQDLLRDTPDDPELHLAIANALKTLGRTEEAIAAYRRTAAARPRHGEAYWSLANLKTYRFSEADIQHMRAVEALPGLATEDRYHFCFALGKAYEDAGNYSESFAYYARGNALKKTEIGYRPEPLERNARLQVEICTAEFFAARKGVGCESAAPIFIVGLPRSGSTLLEQILASHPEVDATMELADIPRLVQDLEARAIREGSTPYPGVLAELDPAVFKRFGEEYLALTRLQRGGKPYFIDKMPNNFRHIGLIHLMLPNAKIIDARREPMACAFGNFKQLFASGQQFTYSLEDLARYYRMYEDLMLHWNRVLPGKILLVRHEDVVLDLEGSVRRLLSFCGLDFDPACVAFHRTQRPIHSASSEQVRQPINREGLDHWRHYEPWLEPLQRALLAPR
jgi:tetratricopeptide (TPR) repeat protein